MRLTSCNFLAAEWAEMYFGILLETCHSFFHHSLLRFLNMQLYSVFLTIAVDPTLGKVDKSSFSMQTLMELFITGIENREVICGSGEEPDDIDKWKGFKYCPEQPPNTTEKLFTINWYDLHLVGTIDLQWLSQTISSLNMAGSTLNGYLSLSSLPLFN